MWKCVGMCTNICMYRYVCPHYFYAYLCTLNDDMYTYIFTVTKYEYVFSSRWNRCYFHYHPFLVVTNYSWFLMEMHTLQSFHVLYITLMPMHAPWMTTYTTSMSEISIREQMTETEWDGMGQKMRLMIMKFASKSH